MGTLAAGIKEIFATAKTTGYNVMLCGNDGTPDGHMTMANLASVLGGINGVVDNADTLSGSANNVITNSFYHIQDNIHTVTDIPDVCKLKSNLVTIVSVSRKANIKIVIQFLYKQTDGRSFIRIGYAASANGTNITWEHDWQEYTLNMPTFYKNYADLSSLANAIGALYHMFNYTYEIQSGEHQLIENTYLGAVVFCTSRNSGKTYIMQIPYYTGFEETYGEEFKVKRTSVGSSAVIENMSGNTVTVKLIVFGMDF